MIDLNHKHTLVISAIAESILLIIVGCIFNYSVASFKTINPV